MTLQQPIPGWTSVGIVPPIRPGADGTSADRSPYQVELAQFCEQLGTTPERRAILSGLLDFRQALHQAGVVQGFQWLDGSFMEQVEVTEGRAPRDVDVVTFFYLPAGETQGSLAGRAQTLFDHSRLKQVYNVDAYFSILGQPLSSPMVKQISYWYSLWSHRRDGLWKGFVQVSLAPDQDAAATQVLLAKGGLDHG
ncbi:DUF6932 family protein [Marinobacter zhejiangensis]|uniref:Uncharacterized protein n=1 Tax=Marinobacter zhejiangensis TaxID=488535 RepID=A0A1I4T0N6_9GAMM|nr:hypothetical protein [Marinobacter zhejiangensis]SFM70294.1 hypothetical protein SAMN04487963_3426 [Marinobacter zhejiangensis]